MSRKKKNENEENAISPDSAAVPSNSANYAGAIAGARQQTPLESQAYCDPEGDAALPGVYDHE